VLDAMGVDGAQGYYYSRPVVASGVPYLVSDAEDGRTSRTTPLQNSQASRTPLH
jgi:EAL domain-containing protein (putative c-di-GMP-specific phosphodiesterase class I)